jgi:hypothetical protein
LIREQRTEEATKLASELVNGLEGLGLDKNQFIIGVADRKIENWMIPFIDACYGSAGGTAQTLPYKEGTSDLGRLKVALRERNVGYHKTTVGANLLASIRPSKLAEYSASFAAFRNQLLNFCPWMHI